MEKSRTDWPLVFEGQLVHAGALAMLLMFAIAATALPGALDGAILGIPTWVWFAVMIADTVIHQLYVWFCWRMELHGRRLSLWVGDTERAFRYYALGFALMFGARFVLVILLAISNRGTLDINPIIGNLIAVAIAVPAAYLFYSVNAYFGFRRAFGIDHFDPMAANLPLVREGIFRFTSNGMYVFGIGALWIPAFALQSLAALIAAAFSHAYIWVHYVTVERPDMRRIYGQRHASAQASR